MAESKGLALGELLPSTHDRRLETRRRPVRAPIHSFVAAHTDFLKYHLPVTKRLW